jgi:hypothetical protein
MIARRLRRRFRLLSILPLALWAWKERHVLGGMAGFARTVPDRVKLGRTGEIGLAAKVHWALLRDESLKGANVRLGAIQGGDVCLEVAPGSEADGERARRLLERVPGVTAVRLEGCDAVPAVDAGTATTVAGDGEVATVPVRV